MKRKNIDKHLNRLSKIANANISDLKDTLKVLDGKVYKLVKLVEIMLNNQKIVFPNTSKEVIEIQKLPNSKTYADLSNFFTNKPIYLYGDLPYKEQKKRFIGYWGTIKYGKLVKPEYSIDKVLNGNKEEKKDYHITYTGTHATKPKQPTVLKRPKRNNKKTKIKQYNPLQSKLVCIKNIDTNEIIRIRKHELEKEIANKKWDNWIYATKSEYKAYVKSNIDPTIKKQHPFRNMFNKSEYIKINLAKAFHVVKDQQVKISGTKVVSTDEINTYQGKGYNKTKYITKEVAKGILPVEQAGKNKTGTKTIKKDSKKNKLVTKRLYISPKNKDEKGRYVTKKVLEEVTPIEVISIYEPIEKVNKVRKLVKKKTEHVPGKIFSYFKPKIVQATKFISSVNTKKSSVYNNKKNMYIEVRNDEGNVMKRFPKIIEKYSKTN